MQILTITKKKIEIQKRIIMVGPPLKSLCWLDDAQEILLLERRSADKPAIDIAERQKVFALSGFMLPPY